MEKTFLNKEDLELHQAFEKIVSKEGISDAVVDIAQLICDDKLTKKAIEEVLDNYGISSVENIKVELLDLLLLYINIILEGHVVSVNEKKNIAILKKYFKIKEGDFLSYRQNEIKEILYKQFQILYSDNKIDKDEEVYNVELQEIFDLGYDQFDQFKKEEVIKSLKLGANISDLDTALL